MKRIVIAVLVLTTSVFAQEETLLGPGEISHGGFGGPVVKFTQVNDQFGVLVGGRGGWLINHTLVLGGGGYGLVNEVPGNSTFFGQEMLINFGYGGFEMGYIMRSDNIMHPTFHVLIGAGGVSHRADRNNDWWDNDYYNDKADVFFVLEPEVNLEANITSFLRMQIGVSYRFISGIDDYNFTNSDFSGVSGNFVLKFGTF